MSSPDNFPSGQSQGRIEIPTSAQLRFLVSWFLTSEISGYVFHGRKFWGILGKTNAKAASQGTIKTPNNENTNTINIIKNTQPLKELIFCSLDSRLSAKKKYFPHSWLFRGSSREKKPWTSATWKTVYGDDDTGKKWVWKHCEKIIHKRGIESRGDGK